MSATADASSETEGLRNLIDPTARDLAIDGDSKELK